MRIAYICADFGIPIRGHKGASVHVREMTAALAALGHEVRVLSPQPGEGNALAVPMTLVPAGGLPAACEHLARRMGRHPRLDKEIREVAYNLTLYRDAMVRLRPWRPDALYERYSLFNLAGLAIARRLGVPHLLEVNAPLRLERARTKGLALGRMARLVERAAFGGADALLTVSIALRDYAVAHGAPFDRVVVQPNAVDTARFRPDADRAGARARLGLAAGTFVAGFAGSLKPWHGTETLLDAFTQLAAERQDARLLVVGEGPQGPVLRARVSELGLGARAIFTGAVAHAAMPDLLAAMDVGVAPYLAADDFYFSPLKVYEYMATGLPVVASAAGEIPSLVADGRTGLLCPPGDPAALSATLRRLAGDPDLRARLGTAARAEAVQHTWAENARRAAEHAAALAPGRRRFGRRTAIWGQR